MARPRKLSKGDAASLTEDAPLSEVARALRADILAIVGRARCSTTRYRLVGTSDHAPDAVTFYCPWQKSIYPNAIGVQFDRQRLCEANHAPLC